MHFIKNGLATVGTLNFFDDILVTTETWDKHLQSISALLDMPEQHGLTVKLLKVCASFKEIEFLRHIMSGGQISSNLDLTTAIHDMTITVTKKQVKAVLGLMGYYRKFVPSSLLKLLTDLTSNKHPTKICWADECNKAFEKVKEILTSRPVLQLPD